MRTLLLCLSVALGASACSDATMRSGDPQPVTPPGADRREAPEADAGAPAPDARTPDPVPDAAPRPPPPDPLVLVVDTPARGARVDGDRVNVTGRLTGGEAPRLTVGGQLVVPGPDGRFSADVPSPAGLTRIITEAQAGDEAAQDVRAVLRGADEDPAAVVDDAVRATVGPAGLDALADVVAAYVETIDLTELVGDTGEFEIESLTYDGVEVALTPRDGHLGVRLVVKDLRVRARAEVDLVFTVNIRGSAEARRAIIDADLHMAPSADGGLDLSVRGGEVNLEGFDYDINNVPDFAEGWFRDRVRRLAEDFMEDALADFVIPALFDPSALDQSLEILGTTLDLGLRVQAADVTPAGLAVGLSAQAVAPDVVRPGGALPTTPGEGTHGGAHADVGARDGLIGRLLHAAWAGGVLDLTVGPGGVAELPAGVGFGLFRGALGEAAEGLDRDAAMVLRTRPLLPPVVRVGPGDHPLTVDVGDLLLDIEVEGRVLATVSMHLEVGVALEVVQADTGIELVPDLTVTAWTDTADAPVGPVDEAALEQRVATFANLLPGLIAGQTFAVGADALPIPVGLEGARVEAEDEAWLHVRTGIVAP